MEELGDPYKIGIKKIEIFEDNQNGASGNNAND
jgi:hypothetical protein